MNCIYRTGCQSSEVCQKEGRCCAPMAVQLIPLVSKKYSRLAADFLANFIETSDSFRSAVKHFATWLDDSRAVETTCSVRPHDFCSAGTCAVCLDAARYHAIRAARVGSHGCCEIWNVAYVGRQLDEAMDAVMASNAVKTTCSVSEAESHE